MRISPRPFRPLLWLALLLALIACARPAARPFTLTIVHVNDTHSAVEPSEAALNLAGRQVAARLGGFERLTAALDEVRARGENVLALHAGDAVQGTLYFNLFQGSLDFDFLNRLGIEAMTLGNHEFDRGPALTGSLVGRARFPVVSANLDVSAEPALAGRVKPYVVKRLGEARVGIVGATTPVTPEITASVGGVRFLPVAPAVEAAVRELRAQGVDAVVVLSHIGYAEDIALAKAVPGIDVIVGGHSHTLLGDAAALKALGLTPAGPYPTEVVGPDGRTTLVVQAWCWGMQLGVLSVSFDGTGRVAGYSARPLLLAGDEFRQAGAAVPKGSPEHAALASALQASGAARVVAGDRAAAAWLAPYVRQLGRFRGTGIKARAGADLIRNTATDPGPLVADAFLAKVPAARIALVMPGNVRRDILEGEITLETVLGVLPFGNTLVTLDLTGAELKAVLEEAAQFRLKVRPPDRLDPATLQVFYAGGFTCAVDPARDKGGRVSDVRVRRPDGRFEPLDPAATYRLVTSSFLANGGDGLSTLKNARGARVDTGHLEHDALAAHLRSLGVVQPPADKRVVVKGAVERPAGRPVLFLRRPAWGRMGEAA